jgi:hypothetical protein
MEFRAILHTIVGRSQADLPFAIGDQNLIVIATGAFIDVALNILDLHNIIRDR